MAQPIGTMLQEWRQERQLSLGKLALIAGVHKATLSRWEAGVQQPGIRELEAVLNALDATSSQRVQALSAIEAPRAIQRLRQMSEGGPPIGGDLLRAMRLRRELTQEEVAARMGVQQSTLTRWERGESLPSPEHLHALCYTLDAREEELVALTTGRFPLPLPENEQLSHGLLHDRFKDVFFGLDLQSIALRDLNLFSLEARLWQLMPDQDWARDLLAHIYGWHAQYCRERGWYGETKMLMGHLHALTRQDASIFPRWLNHITVAAYLTAHSGSSPSPLRGALVLKKWLDSLERPLRAWAMSDMALYIAQAGDYAMAERLAQEACVTAVRAGAYQDLRFRQRSLAEVLIQAGHPTEALSALPDSPALHPVVQLFETQARAEALWMLGRMSEAEACIRQCCTLMETYHMTGLRGPTDALMRRLAEEASWDGKARPLSHSEGELLPGHR